MTVGYTIRELAKTDLEKIWFYTYQEWELDQADNYLKLLISPLALYGLLRILQLAKSAMILKQAITVFLKVRILCSIQLLIKA